VSRRALDTIRKEFMHELIQDVKWAQGSGGASVHII